MTAEQGMIDIGRTCGIVEPSITSVKSWLACKSQRWLMIIDNADNFKINYSEYMPSSKRGDIILTTRNPECVAYETAGNEPLDGLEPKLAQELLLRATFTPESRWKEKEEAAIAVIRILGSHTLAIVQAGAFVRKKLCSLEEYPIFFQQQKAQLLKFHSEANTSTYGNVYATFEVSAEYLQKSALPEYLDALELLHILAFLHSDGILETLFQRASEYATEVRTSDQTDDEKPFFLSMRHLARLPAYVQREWSSNLQDRMRWRKACAILESLSLIATHEDDSSIGFSMHSLIHAWAKERQDHQSRCLAWQSAASVLGLSCKDVYDFDPFFIYLQSHVQACVGHRVETLTIDISDTEVAQILIQLAYVLYRTQNWSSLSSLVQQIRLRLHDTHKISQETREAVETLNARVCEYEGDYGKAVDLFRDVLEGRARRLPEDDPNRLVSEHELACAYLANGQIGEAVSLLEHVVKFREELAENDPDRLTSQHEFARAYLENGQLDKAIDLLKYVNKIQEQLAENHPSRLASQHELARAYSKDGQIDKAIDLFQYVVKFREQLAEDHPDRLASQHELARAYLAKGQIDEAIDLFEHVVRVKEKKLAEGHPDRLVSQHELAGAYLESGQIDEGIHLFEHVVRITERKLAEDHPSRLASQRGLAHAYLANGQIVEAINLFEQIVRVCDGKLTENHPIRLRSQRELALAYQAKRQVQEE